MRAAVALAALVAIALPCAAEARPGVPTAANFCKLKAGTVDRPGSYVRTAIWRMGQPDDWYRPSQRSAFDPSMSWYTRRFIFRAFLTPGGTRILSLNIDRRGRWKPPCEEVRGNETPTPEPPLP